jgi:transcription elongation GreA/GreB family factor
MNREQVIGYVVQKLEEERQQLYESYSTHLEATNQASSAMTSRYDTTREEMGAVADAIAQKITGLDELIGRIRNMPVSQGRIQLGALARIVEEERQYYVLFVPEGAGGREIELTEREMRIITIAPTSPVGRALLRKEAGDEVEINLPSGARTLEVLEVR